MKAHADGLNGGEKFGLLLAYLTKGDVKGESKLPGHRERVGANDRPAGQIQSKYSNDAKEAGFGEHEEARGLRSPAALARHSGQLIRQAMDFNQNLKAFLKQLPLAKMSGHQKFVAIAAVQCAGRSSR